MRLGFRLMLRAMPLMPRHLLLGNWLAQSRPLEHTWFMLAHAGLHFRSSLQPLFPFRVLHRDLVSATDQGLCFIMPLPIP